MSLYDDKLFITIVYELHELQLAPKTVNCIISHIHTTYILEITGVGAKRENDEMTGKVCQMVP